MKIDVLIFGRVAFQAMVFANALHPPIQAQVKVDFPSDSTDLVQSEQPDQWSHRTSIAIPSAESSSENRVLEATSEPKLADVILGPEVFSKARLDLADVRLFDSTGQAIPFALRYLRDQKLQQTVPAREFNRDEPDDKVHQLTLDLLQNDIQHNEIKIETTGDNFRRRLEIDGSDDGFDWRRLFTGNLIRFTEGEQMINIDTFHYPDSRFRFMRVRVSPDPNGSTIDDAPDRFDFREVSVLREIDVPGERLTMEATLGPRHGVRSLGSPASAWIIELGGENIPCDQIEFDVANKEFVRDISIQAELPYGPLGQNIFTEIYGPYTTTWQRKTGDPQSPMIATFNEIQTSRLRLLVTDYRNAPLTIRSVKLSAPARQIIFSRPDASNADIRLFVGNPAADAPYYDFSRNLPAELNPSPIRGELQALVVNPNFVPPPKAFFERFPWLIYAVLTAVTTALAIVIASLARTAIALHDTPLGIPNQKESTL